MPSCLGLYIENNLIKYAKVSKNNDLTKIESFGIKFYENVDEAIKQIIEETYSFKIPISANLVEEKYNYFDTFGKLSKKDIDGIIKTKFENYCYDHELNKDSFEKRYIFANSPENKEQVRAIHIASPKISVTKRKNQLSSYKLHGIYSTGLAITNLVTQATKGASIIVNMENKTTITKISNNMVQDVKQIPIGAGEILDKISAKENSQAKSYEICKNTTIYTDEGKDLQYEENEYLEDIMPTLYNIITEVRKYTNETLDNIEKIYLTGTLSVINNIDIYFQEYLKSAKCEILKPYFVTNNSKINIKDYIEVNSAIAMAMQMLDNKKANQVNFLKEMGVMDFLNSDVKAIKFNEIDLNGLYDKHTSLINVLSSSGLMLLIAYIIMTAVINGMLNKKSQLTLAAKEDVNSKKSVVEGYTDKINSRITKYKTMIDAIEKSNDKASEDKRYKDTIPNLMNNLMAIIPKEVQLRSIENTNTSHIVITAKSKRYEQLAFFKTKIKTEEILKNVISNTGVAGKEDITITIEGELP